MRVFALNCAHECGAVMRVLEVDVGASPQQQLHEAGVRLAGRQHESRLVGSRLGSEVHVARREQPLHDRYGLGREILCTGKEVTELLTSATRRRPTLTGAHSTVLEGHSVHTVLFVRRKTKGRFILRYVVS